MRPKIAIVGPGNVGSALGGRLESSGFAVVYGVREGSDAKSAGKAARASVKEAASGADVIFLAVPGQVALEAAKGLGPCEGKIVVDCNNAIRWDGGPVWNPPAEGSLAQAIQKALPGARVVKAFNQFGAEYHADPKVGDTNADVFLAGDDAEAKAIVSSVAEAAGFRPIDAGPLRNASVLENLAVLWIHLAMVGGQGRDIVFKMLSR
jgi:NADPH-dependent F420 reductase